MRVGRNTLNPTVLLVREAVMYRPKPLPTSLWDVFEALNTVAMLGIWDHNIGSHSYGSYSKPRPPICSPPLSERSRSLRRGLAAAGLAG